MFHHTKCLASLILHNCVSQMEIFLNTPTALLCFKLVIVQFYFRILQHHIYIYIFFFPLRFSEHFFPGSLCCTVYLMTSWSNSVYKFCQHSELASVGVLVSWPAFQVCWWHILEDDLTPIIVLLCVYYFQPGCTGVIPFFQSLPHLFILDSACPTPVKSFLLPTVISSA